MTVKKTSFSMEEISICCPHIPDHETKQVRLLPNCRTVNLSIDPPFILVLCSQCWTLVSCELVKDSAQFARQLMDAVKNLPRT